MLPTLWPGDVLTVQSRCAEQVEPGEIVLYKRGGRFFVHRVICKSIAAGDTLLLARGDCMPQADPPVQSGEVLGKITEIHRAGLSFPPPRKLSRFRRMVAYMLCRSNRLRSVGLRLWERSHRGDGQVQHTPAMPSIVTGVSN